MPRPKFYGYFATIVSITLWLVFIYYSFYLPIRDGFLNEKIISSAYYALSVPVAVLVLVICGTGFWIGWTILTIKVAPPMPEIVEKKDYAKFKAFVLCATTLALMILFAYGVYVQSYWALAIPAAAFTFVILGMIFWVGIAIITTRRTLPEEKK
ncbi:MAG: hypothetical protein N2316_11130 [Spirochaetes bacterium]|nr:hypothetical protein [Spirochaetota bacterium]